MMNAIACHPVNSKKILNESSNKQGIAEIQE